MKNPVFGTIRVEFTRGSLINRTFSVRGEVKVKGGGKVESTANLDGTVSRSFEPGPVKIDLTFQRGALPLTEAELLGLHDIVVTEEHAGVVHQCIDAFFTGEPEESGKSGDLSGLVLEVASRDYLARQAG